MWLRLRSAITYGVSIFPIIIYKKIHSLVVIACFTEYNVQAVGCPTGENDVIDWGIFR